MNDREALWQAFLAGFKSTGEGWNNDVRVYRKQPPGGYQDDPADDMQVRADFWTWHLKMAGTVKVAGALDGGDRVAWPAAQDSTATVKAVERHVGQVDVALTFVPKLSVSGEPMTTWESFGTDEPFEMVPEP